MANKSKYYVVWEGHNSGIFDSWKECEKSVKNYEGAKYKAFESLEQAKEALQQPFYKFIGAAKRIKPSLSANETPVWDSIAVDAAWNTVTKDMEYQGVHAQSKQPLFKVGPIPKATNNIGEFLAIVHALALCKQKNDSRPIYTDSITAMAWVRNKKAKTTLAQSAENMQLFDYIDRAENWLKNNHYPNKILKWNTEAWGEIPADFGRK